MNTSSDEKQAGMNQWFMLISTSSAYLQYECMFPLESFADWAQGAGASDYTTLSGGGGHSFIVYRSSVPFTALAMMKFKKGAL